MTRPLILDLYAGAGLVAEGLERAGFQPVGVDDRPQRRYPGPILVHDALTLDDRFLDLFRFIWASPPCLRDTIMKHAKGAKGDTHPDLITPTRAMLQRWAARTGGRYVIENVEEAPLVNPVILCGSMFDLGADHDGRRFHLERHRKFETHWSLRAPTGCYHLKPVVGVYGGHARVRAASAGGRGTKEPWGGRSQVEIMAQAMGCRPELTGAEISQGIPPIYAQYVAEHMLADARQRRVA